jgi:LPS export ABC transporter protein LptC
MGLILLAVGGFLLMNMQRGDEEIIPTADTKADLSLHEIHYVETKGEKKEWELRAKSAHHFLKEDLTLLKNLTVTFFAEGDKVIIMRGKEGSIKRRKEIEVRGNVEITSSDGYRVVTESLHYTEEKRQIYTRDPVMLEKKGMRLRGIGLLVDLNKEKLYIQKAVETEIEG